MGTPILSFGDLWLITLHRQPLTPAHGYPLRVVLPGYIGARSVKWIDTIAIRRGPSKNFYQGKLGMFIAKRVALLMLLSHEALDYKLLRPDNDMDLARLQGSSPADKAYRKAFLAQLEPIMKLGVSCVVARPKTGDRVAIHTSADRKWIKISGYAIGQDGELFVSHISY